MSANKDTEPTAHTGGYLSLRSDVEIRQLQSAYPLVINDCANPAYEFGRQVFAEAKRRRLF